MSQGIERLKERESDGEAAGQWSGQNTRIYQLSLPFDMGADHGTLTQILN